MRELIGNSLRKRSADYYRLLPTITDLKLINLNHIYVFFLSQFQLMAPYRIKYSRYIQALDTRRTIDIDIKPVSTKYIMKYNLFLCKFAFRGQDEVTQCTKSTINIRIVYLHLSNFDLETSTRRFFNRKSLKWVVLDLRGKLAENRVALPSIWVSRCLYLSVYISASVFCSGTRGVGHDVGLLKLTKF